MQRRSWLVFVPFLLHVFCLSLACYGLLGVPGEGFAQDKGFPLYPSADDEKDAPSPDSDTPVKSKHTPGGGPALKIGKSTSRRSLGTFQIGAGYGMNEGFLFSAKIAKKNLFQIEGLNISLGSRISAIRQNFDLDFEGKFGRRSPFFWKLQSYFHQTQLTPGDTGLSGGRAGGLIGVGMRMASGWSVFLGYRLAHQTLENGALLRGAPLHVPQGHWEQDRLLSAAVARLEYRSHDPDAPGPTPFLQGFHFRASLEHSSPLLGSSYNYNKVELGARLGIPLPFGAHLSFEAKAGSFFGRDSQIPFMERYRLGGPTSNFETLLPVVGPEHRIGDQVIPLGGNAMALARTELKIPIYKPIGLYIFGGFEAAAIVNHDIQPNSLAMNLSWNVGASLGLLWLSPIGPLRFRWTFPLLHNPNAPPVLFGFSTGTHF